MKTKIIALALMALVLSIPVSFAQETTEEETGGVAPDSVLYGLDKALDSISLALTFNKEKKAEKGLIVARERLLEVQKMIEENKLEHAEKAENEHRKAVEKSEKALEDLESNGDAEKSKEAIEKVARVQKKIESHAEKVALVKDRILERQRERMSPEQIAKLEEVFTRIKAKAQEMESKVEAKKENLKTKYKTLSKKTDAEVETEVEEIEKEAGLDKAKEEKTKKATENSEDELTEETETKGNQGKTK